MRVSPKVLIYLITNLFMYCAIALGSLQAQDVSFILTRRIAPEKAFVADLNGDGMPDLVAGGTVLLGIGDGRFRSGGFFGFCGGCITLAFGDFNGDGFQDLVVLSNASFYLYLNISSLPSVNQAEDSETRTRWRNPALSSTP